MCVCMGVQYCEDLKSFPDKIYATDLSYYTQDRLPLGSFFSFFNEHTYYIQEVSVYTHP